MSDKENGQGTRAWTEALEEARKGIPMLDEEYARQIVDIPSGVVDEVIAVIDQQAYPLRMVKQWLMGPEPELGSVTPLEALRNGRRDDVLLVAKRLGK